MTTHDRSNGLDDGRSCVRPHWPKAIALLAVAHLLCAWSCGGTRKGPEPLFDGGDGGVDEGVATAEGGVDDSGHGTQADAGMDDSGHGAGGDGGASDAREDLSSPIVPMTNAFSDRPVVAVHYHTFVFEWSNWRYATYVPLVGTDAPEHAAHPGYLYNSGVMGWTDSMIEQHVKWAKAYGIDVFILHANLNCEDRVNPDCSHRLPVQPREVLSRIIRVFEEQHMPWFYFTEGGPMTDSVARAAFLADLNAHKTDRSYVRLDDRPVVMTYGAVSKSPQELRALRGEMESVAGPLYFVGDFLDAAMYTDSVHPSCKRLAPKLPPGEYVITARLRSKDSAAHGYSLHVVDNENGGSQKILSANISSSTYSETELGTFEYDALYPLRLADWSQPGLIVDWLRITSTHDPDRFYFAEAEDVSGGIEVREASASGGKAVTRYEQGIYSWWVLPFGFKSLDLAEYLPIVDAVSAYGIPATVDESWPECLEKTYSFFDGRSVPYTGWAGPGFRCDYAPWCTNVVPYGPSAIVLRRLLDLAAAKSNWIIIRSWNEFYEGTNIEPTEELGDWLMDALRDFKRSR